MRPVGELKGVQGVQNSALMWASTTFLSAQVQAGGWVLTGKGDSGGGLGATGIIAWTEG